MFKIMLSMMMIMFSNFMYFLNHPLSMGLSILIQCMMICLLTGMMMNTYWFSYILFLTFLGGLLVLFIYMSSISSNEMFKYNTSMYLNTLMSIIIIILISFLFKNNMFWMNFSFNNEMEQMMNKFLFFNNENKINLIKLYNENNIIMYMMIIYLLISLIVMVKITNIFYGPIRTM